MTLIRSFSIIFLSFLAIADATQGKQSGNLLSYYKLSTKKVSHEYGLVKRGNDNFEVSLIPQTQLYLAKLQIGSRREEIEVAIDTGSSDFWVISSDDANCSNNDEETEFDSLTTMGNNSTNVDQNTLTVTVEIDEVAHSISKDSSLTTYPVSATKAKNSFNTGTSGVADCSLYGIFNPGESETFNNNGTDFAVTYGDGSYANGYWGQDEVFFNNVSVGTINIGIANDTSRVNGILGLGPIDDESTYTAGTIFDSYTYSNFPLQLVENGIIKRAAYSIYMDIENEANILFGAIDASKYYGDLYEFPIVETLMTHNKPYISITLNSVSLVENDLSETTILLSGYSSALLDTGSTYGTAPYAFLKDLQKHLGLKLNTQDQIYYSECSLLANYSLTFEFQGVPFTVPLMNFFAIISMDNETSVCGLALSSDNLSETFVLGDSFLNNMYYVVDLEGESVGLAYAETTFTDSEKIELIETGIPNVKQPPLTDTYDISNMIYSTIEESYTRVTNLPKSMVTKSINEVSMTLTGVYGISDQARETESVSHSTNSSSILSVMYRHSGAACTNKSPFRLPFLQTILYIISLI